MKRWMVSSLTAVWDAKRERSGNISHSFPNWNENSLRRRCHCSWCDDEDNYEDNEKDNVEDSYEDDDRDWFSSKMQNVNRILNCISTNMVCYQMMICQDPGIHIKLSFDSAMHSLVVVRTFIILPFAMSFGFASNTIENIMQRHHIIRVFSIYIMRRDSSNISI